MSYEPFWMPESSASDDLAAGARWLRAATYPAGPIIVVNTLKYSRDVPEFAELAKQFSVVSPQAKDRPIRGGHAVLAPWVIGETLDLAERLADPGGGLLVIDSEPRHDSVEAWVARTGATALVEVSHPSEEAAEDGINVFWEPARYAPNGVEAELPDGIRLKPTALLGGRRVGFERGLPRGTLLVVGERVLWVVGGNPE